MAADRQHFWTVVVVAGNDAVLQFGRQALGKSTAGIRGGNTRNLRNKYGALLKGTVRCATCNVATQEPLRPYLCWSNAALAAASPASPAVGMIASTPQSAKSPSFPSLSAAAMFSTAAACAGSNVATGLSAGCEQGELQIISAVGRHFEDEWSRSLTDFARL
ncbi:MAG: hypothetical protein JNK48_25990 [Bryobacterales bacterium]|nr:hypothetical protein [Bryobacterales bacterium]